MAYRHLNAIEDELNLLHIERLRLKKQLGQVTRERDALQSHNAELKAAKDDTNSYLIKTQASNTIKVVYLRLSARRLQLIADGETRLREHAEAQYTSELARLRNAQFAHMARSLPFPKTWAGSKIPFDELEQLPSLESNELPSDDSSDDEYVKVAPALTASVASSEKEGVDFKWLEGDIERFGVDEA